VSILFASEAEPVRMQVKQALRHLKNLNPTLRVLDVGAAANPWLGDVVTDTLDFFPVTRHGYKFNTHLGDINKASSFSCFQDNEFDFVSCTHTLEDVRDPLVVISEMQRVAKAGFIAVPNRHTELSNLQKHHPFGSPSSLGGHHLGFAHHRWVFHVRSVDKLEAVAKWSGVSSTESRYEYAVRLASSLPLINLKQKGILARLGVREQGDYSWIKNELVGMPEVAELSVLWVDSFSFEYLNNDYAGFNYAQMYSLFRGFVASPPLICSYDLVESLAKMTAFLVKPD
jgi:hypothetical protein